VKFYLPERKVYVLGATYTRREVIPHMATLKKSIILIVNFKVKRTSILESFEWIAFIEILIAQCMYGPSSEQNISIMVSRGLYYK